MTSGECAALAAKTGLPGEREAKFKDGRIGVFMLPNSVRPDDLGCSEGRDGETMSLEDPVSDRKYRQPGYMDRGEDSQKKSSDRPQKKENTFGPRPLQMAATRTVSRCAQCGTVLQMLSSELGQCPKCGFELHSCKQCSSFDPASRFECTQPIAERVPRKDVKNNCSSYSMRVMVEKETTNSAARVDDARKAFENLFKK